MSDTLNKFIYPPSTGNLLSNACYFAVIFILVIWLGYNYDEALGVRILKRALEQQMRQIAHNAGHKGAVVVARVRKDAGHNFGFNVASGRFTDIVEAGIIDPTRVTRLALQNAASVAGLLLMTGSVVAEVLGQTQEVRQP